MRQRSGMIVVLAAGLALGGCAAAGTAAGGGTPVSPIGRVYEPGTPPRQTRFGQAALLAIAQGRFEQGLEEARAGIAEDAENPLHFYLAGEAAAGLGDYELADSMWIVAEEIYPAYELEIEPSRESAWAEAFNAGIETYEAGDLEATVESWRSADLIYKLRPEAVQNLGVVLTQTNEYEEAISAYQSGIASLDLEPATRIIEAEEQAQRDEARRFMQRNLADLLLFTGQFAEAERLLRAQLELDPGSVEIQGRLADAIARQGRAEEATAIYSRLLAEPNIPVVDLFNIGVALFTSEDFDRAAEAFGRVSQVQQNSRDALYNQANSLYAVERWADLIPIGERLIRVDPLNSNAALILARSHRELGDNAAALRALEANEAYPVFLEGIELSPNPDRTVLTGRVIGNQAAAGTPIRLRFTFYSDAGATLGTVPVTINAPAREATGTFEVVFDQAASAYGYQVEP